MCWVMRFTLGEGSASIHDYMIFSILFLVQDSTQPKTTGISMHLEGFSEVSKGQNWGKGAQNLQHIKGPLAFICPLNFSFLMSCIAPGDLVIERVSNFSITLDKAFIIVCEPQKAPQFCDCGGNGPFLDSFDFMTIGLDALL